MKNVLQEDTVPSGQSNASERCNDQDIPAHAADEVCTAVVKFHSGKRRPSQWLEEMIYSPNKYRETEGTKVRLRYNDADG